MADPEILKRLDRLAEGVESINTTMNKPESMKKKIMELVGFVISVLGLIIIADVIRGWVI